MYILWLFNVTHNGLNFFIEVARVFIREGFMKKDDIIKTDFESKVDFALDMPRPSQMRKQIGSKPKQTNIPYDISYYLSH